jgi:predicted esterase
MQEVHIEVARSARYFVLGTPGPDVDDVWIVCHGFAQLASRFLKRFQPFAVDSRLIVAPEALNRFYVDTSPRPHGPDDVVGATWMTREDREYEIKDYVRFLDGVAADVARTIQHAGLRPRVLGFSQGVATVCRWITLGQVQPSAVVLWSGNVPHDLDVGQRAVKWRAAQPVIVWGDRDARANAGAIERDRARLLAAGIPAEFVEFPGGHELAHQPLADLLSRR